MCGVCGVFNWLDRTSCRNCFTQHNAVPGKGGNGGQGGKGSKGKGGGKGGGNQPTLNATVEAVRAAGVSEATVQSLKQEAAQAKQDKLSLGAKLDSATAKARKAKDLLRRSEEAVQTALEKQAAAAKAVEEAERDLAELRSKASAGLLQRSAQVEPTVASEARSLLQLLENAPLCSTVGNTVVPATLLAEMQSLRAALTAEGLAMIIHRPYVIGGNSLTLQKCQNICERRS